MWARASLLFALGLLVPAAALATGHPLGARGDAAPPSSAVPSGIVWSPAKALEAAGEGLVAFHSQRRGGTSALFRVGVAGDVVLEHGEEPERQQAPKCTVTLFRKTKCRGEKFTGRTANAKGQEFKTSDKKWKSARIRGACKSVEFYDQDEDQRGSEDNMVWTRKDGTPKEFYDRTRAVWNFPINSTDCIAEFPFDLTSDISGLYIVASARSLRSSCAAPSQEKPGGGEVWRTKACDPGDPCSKTCGDRIDSLIFRGDNEERSREIVATAYLACSVCFSTTTTTTTTTSTTTSSATTAATTTTMSASTTTTTTLMTTTTTLPSKCTVTIFRDAGCKGGSDGFSTTSHREVKEGDWSWGNNYWESARVRGSCTSVEFYDQDQNRHGYYQNTLVKGTKECFDFKWDLSDDMSGLYITAR